MGVKVVSVRTNVWATRLQAVTRQDQRRAVQSRIGTHQPAPLKKKKKNVVGIVIANPFIDQRCWDYIVGSFRS